MVWKDGIRGTEGLTHLAFWLILPSVHAEAGPGSATTGPYEVLKAFCGPGRPRRPPHLCVRAAVPRACRLLNIFLSTYVAEITMF